MSSTAVSKYEYGAMRENTTTFCYPHRFSLQMVVDL